MNDYNNEQEEEVRTRESLTGLGLDSGVKDLASLSRDEEFFAWATHRQRKISPVTFEEAAYQLAMRYCETECRECRGNDTCC